MPLRDTTGYDGSGVGGIHSLADGRELPATGDGVKSSRKYRLVPVRKLATPMYDPSPTGEPLGQYGTA